MLLACCRIGCCAPANSSDVIATPPLLDIYPPLEAVVLAIFDTDVVYNEANTPKVVNT